MRPFCLKELRWAVEAGVIIQPVVAAEDKGRITEFFEMIPEDLQHLKGVNWQHIDRKDKRFFELGVTMLCEAAGLEEEEMEDKHKTSVVRIPTGSTITIEQAKATPPSPPDDKPSELDEVEKDYLGFLKSSGQVPAEHPPQAEFDEFLEASEQLTPKAVRAAEWEFNEGVQQKRAQEEDDRQLAEQYQERAALEADRQSAADNVVHIVAAAATRRLGWDALSTRSPRGVLARMARSWPG